MLKQTTEGVAFESKRERTLLVLSPLKPNFFYTTSIGYRADYSTQIAILPGWSGNTVYSNHDAARPAARTVSTHS